MRWNYAGDVKPGRVAWSAPGHSSANSSNCCIAASENVPDSLGVLPMPQCAHHPRRRARNRCPWLADSMTGITQCDIDRTSPFVAPARRGRAHQRLPQDPETKTPPPGYSGSASDKPRRDSRGLGAGTALRCAALPGPAMPCTKWSTQEPRVRREGRPMREHPSDAVGESWLSSAEYTSLNDEQDIKPPG